MGLHDSDFLIPAIDLMLVQLFAQCTHHQDKEMFPIGQYHKGIYFVLQRIKQKARYILTTFHYLSEI